MFEQENLTGRMDGVFRLTGQGNDMDAVLRSLDGSLSFTLSDGTYEGTDVWYQLRRARALFRQEAPPEPELPPRTRFTEVSATGKVTDGVMQNDDLLADLPFMRLNGSGTVNLVSKEVDYALSARVLDRPELAGQASEAELSDLTKATIPLRVTGSVTEPEIGVDMEGLVKSRVQDELRDRLLERLGGDEEAAEGEEQDKDVEDLLKDRLRDLLNR
jgi:AsmA protein